MTKRSPSNKSQSPSPDTTTLSPQELKKLARKLATREKFQRENPIFFTRLNNSQTSFMDVTTPTRKDNLPKRLIFVASNKQGKTYCGVLRGICLALGEHPFLPDDHPLHTLKNWPIPNVGLVCGEQLSQAVDKKLIPEYTKLIPKICQPLYKKNPQGVVVKITLQRDLKGRPLGSVIHFRCHSDDTEVLTSTGWKLFKDVHKKSDLLMTVNMSNRVLEWQKPIAVYSYKYKGTMIHGKNRDLDYLITPTHNMLVCNYKPRGYDETLVLKPFISLSRRDATPRSFRWYGQPKPFFEVPWGDSVVSVPSGNWMRFAGIFISEGGVDSSGGRGPRSVTISQHDGDSKDKIRKLLEDMPFVFHEFDRGFRIHNMEFSRYMMDMFGSGALKKFIPQDIKDLPAEDLRVLVRWLVIGDGSKVKQKVKSKKLGSSDYTTFYECYYTSSKRLADDFMEVLLKIGLHGYMFVRDKLGKGGFKTNNINYRINVLTKDKSSMLYSNKSKELFWEEVDYDGVVYCAEVANHTLITRRNGRILASGNSYDSNVESFEGIDMNWIAWDEPPPYPHFVAAERGLLPTDGISYMTFTSLKCPWIKDFANDSIDYGGKDKNTRVVEGGPIWNNQIENGGFLTKEAIDEFVRIVPKEEYPARIMGEWMQSGGLIYSSFRDKSPWVIPNFEMPSHWTVVEAMDPHDAKPTKWISAAISPYDINIDDEMVNRVFIMDYLSLSADMTITDMVRAIKRRRIDLGYGERSLYSLILDAKYGKKRVVSLDGKEPVNWESKLVDAGIGYVELSHSKPGDVELGHKIVRAYLRPQYFKMAEKDVPGMVFMERCRGMDGPIEGMLKYRYKLQTYQPDEEVKDIMDPVRYVCMSKPVYIERYGRGRGDRFVPRDERVGR